MYRTACVLALSCAFLLVGSAHAACKDLGSTWFGITPGPMGNFPEGVAADLKRERTTRSVEGVGWETFHGKAQELEVAQLDAYFDRGAFVGVQTIGSLPGRSDLGLAEIVERAAVVVGTQPRRDGEVAVFVCDDGLQLRIEPIPWKGTRQVKIALFDQDARRKMHMYILKYCNSPGMRKPADRCGGD